MQSSSVLSSSMSVGMVSRSGGESSELKASKPEDLKNYTVTPNMLKYDIGVGVVTLYQIKGGSSYFIMGEYHNKGALSPTVGARLKQTQSLFDVINGAFDRKRLGLMHFNAGEIDQRNIYYSVNADQNFARLTFVHTVSLDLTADEFQKKYIDPMHLEAQYQRSVSEFFWKLAETVNTSKVSKFKFRSAEEQAQSASAALGKMELSRFPVNKKILDKLKSLQDATFVWDETISPLEFYGKNGGREYSEFTGFYLIPIVEILGQLKNPKIKSGESDQEKPTIYIEHRNLPQEKWKKFFLFEDELTALVAILNDFALGRTSSMTTFSLSSISNEIKKLKSPWVTSQIGFGDLTQLTMQETANQCKL